MPGLRFGYWLTLCNKYYIFYSLTYSLAYLFAAATTTEPAKPTTAGSVTITTSKKREIQTTVISTTAADRRNQRDADPERSRQTTSHVDEQPKKDNSGAVHAAKRKKLARNDKLVPSDEFDASTDQYRKQTPPTTTDTTSGMAVDRKSASAKDFETVVTADQMKSPSRTDAEMKKHAPGHVTTSEDKSKVSPSVDVSSDPGSGSLAPVEKAVDKDKADILDVDDVDEDDVADSFALFAAQIKTTSGAAAARKPADKEVPVAQAKTDSYDQLSTGGAVIAMADSGYQTYDHDLAALDNGRQVCTIDVKKTFQKNFFKMLKT